MAKYYNMWCEYFFALALQYFLSRLLLLTKCWASYVHRCHLICRRERMANHYNMWCEYFSLAKRCFLSRPKCWASYVHRFCFIHHPSSIIHHPSSISVTGLLMLKGKHFLYLCSELLRPELTTIIPLTAIMRQIGLPHTWNKHLIWLHGRIPKKLIKSSPL